MYGLAAVLPETRRCMRTLARSAPEVQARAGVRGRAWFGALMIAKFCQLHIAVLLTTLWPTAVDAQNKSTEPPPPTWEEMMALGIAPYQQLTVEDFPIDDS